MRSRLSFSAMGAVLFAVLFGWASSAAATSLGGLRSDSLYAQRYSVGSITDDFSDPNGTNLATTTDGCGHTWTVFGGTFLINNGTATASTGGVVTATVPLCDGPNIANEEIGGDIHSSGASTFGLLLHARPGGRPSTSVLYNNSGAGTVQISRIDANGSSTLWAQVTGTGGGNTVRFLRLIYMNGVYTATVNGTQVLSYTVTAAQRTEVEANNDVGIAAFNDTKSSFDNLQSYGR